jgi:phosphatidylserine decarboxylase
VSIRREGYPFIIGAALVSLVLAMVAPFVVAMVPVAFVTWFFRDPERSVPLGEDLVLAPADGTVLDVVAMTEEKVGPCTKVPIFMSVFSVHVNRAPVSGKVIAKRYQKGKFHVASVGKKTDANERMIIYIENQDGIYRVDQVAGLVARRILSFVEVGDTVEAGQRIGLIRFGSLLECFMPEGVHAQVSRGEKVSAGTTVIGRKQR